MQFRGFFPAWFPQGHTVSFNISSLLGRAELGVHLEPQKTHHLKNAENSGGFAVATNDQAG